MIKLKLPRIDATTITGVLDAAVGLTFAVHLDVTYWYLAGIALKIGLIITSRQRGRLSAAEVALLIAISAAGAATVLSGEEVVPLRYGALAAFVVSLYTSMMLVQPNNLKRYLATICVVVAGQAAIHIAYTKAGLEHINYGDRASFFNQHPNLGGEIGAMGCVAGVYSLRHRVFWLCAAIIIADVLQLQARAALITIAPTLLVTIIFNEKQLVRKRGLIISGVLAMVTAPILLFLFAHSGVNQVASDTLMLNASGRGVNSGFSGRTELWAQALDLFGASPIVGHTLGYFDEIGYIGSHNIFFYGLAQFGLMFLPIVSIIFWSYYKAAVFGLFRIATLLCVSPLLLFNDRLVNLNVYPFVFYLLSLKLATVPLASQVNSIGLAAPGRAVRSRFSFINAKTSQRHGAWSRPPARTPK